MAKTMRMTRWDQTGEMMETAAYHQIPEGRMRKKMRISRWDMPRKKVVATIPKPIPELLDEIIFFNILSRLPAKSLFRFRCVNKHWRDTIDDPAFRSAHFIHSKQNPLLVPLMMERRENFSVVNMFSYGPHLHATGASFYFSFSTMKQTFIIGYCNGLFCFGSESGFEIRNVTTREMLFHPFPKLELPPSRISYGFGFDYLRKEYKVIQIGANKCMIHTLGTNSWRDITETSNLSICFNYFSWEGMVSDNALYSNNGLHWFFYPNNRLISFDIRSEKFFLRSGPHQPEPISYCCLFEWKKGLGLAYDDYPKSRDFNLYTCDDICDCDDHKTQLSWATISLIFPFKVSLHVRIGVMSFLGQLRLYWFKFGHFSMFNIFSKEKNYARYVESGRNPPVKSELINHTENLLSLKTFVTPCSTEVRNML